MIVYYNVCSHCNEQSQINTEKNATNKGFEFAFYIQSLTDSLDGRTYAHKLRSETFCDKTCLIEYLKNNLDEQGNIIEKDSDT